VRLVDALADVVEQLAGVHGLASPFEALDDGGVHGRFAQSIEGIDPVEPGRGGSQLARLVQRTQFLTRERAHPVVALLHDLVAVHFQDVPEPLVDQQAPDGEACVIAEIAEILRPSTGDHLVDGRQDREPVHLVLVVDGERVVHVEADPVDARHLEIAIDVHALVARDSDARRR
jgi:hypothetical protein